MTRFRYLLISLFASVGLLTALAADATAVSMALPVTQSAPVAKLIAHRGASSLAPENTIPAFDAAVARGADFIELDIHMSKDGALVVLHDSKVDRTTNGTGAVQDLTLSELRALDAGSKFHPAFAGTVIPTLDEVLTRYRHTTGIVIELKVPSRYSGIEKTLAALLQQHQLHTPDSNIIVQSFDSRSLTAFQQYAPDVPVGVLIDRIQLLHEPQLLKYAAFADYINPNKKHVTPHLVERLHELGVKVAPWTAHSTQEIGALLDIGVDAVITDQLP